MMTSTNNFQASEATTLQELNNFLRVLSKANKSEMPLLKSGGSAERIVMHFEKQFSKVEEPVIFRRLGKHTQLVLNFSQVA